MAMTFKVLKTMVSNGKQIYRHYNGMPFLDFYEKTTGNKILQKDYPALRKKHPNIHNLTQEDLQCSLQVLGKFGIDAMEACQQLHIFSMNPITVDNYGEILKECGFLKILPEYIIKYHTLVRSRTIARLKREGLMKENVNLEEDLLRYFPEWPDLCKSLEKFSDMDTSVLTVRMSVLEKYLIWKLSITSEEFQKYCRNYMPLKHKPMADIRQAIDVALNNIKFNITDIRSNGFIISSDPINTKLILDNVQSVAGMDIREAIKMEPAILKNNYKALLNIRDLLEDYRIPEEAQRRCLKIYCMRPQTVKARLEELLNLNEYRILSSNPRVLSMVVHKNKMMTRLSHIQTAKKQCYSLNHLISSNKVFNNYITNFGNKACSRDIVVLICSSLNPNSMNLNEYNDAQKSIECIKAQLKRHKFWLHSALNVIYENIQFLKTRFSDRTILNNCQLLLYPIGEIEKYVDYLLEMRDGGYTGATHRQFNLDSTYNNIDYARLTDDHLLSLVLYEIEKKYHFSGDGIWAGQEGIKLDTKAKN